MRSQNTSAFQSILASILSHFPNIKDQMSSISFLVPKFAGSVKSLISLPYFMCHAAIPVAVHETRGLTEDLVQISVGIEDVNDL